MSNQDVLDASDITELEEIFANQQKKREASQSGQSLGDVAEFIECNPKKKEPLPVEPEELKERVLHGSVLKTDPILTTPQIQAATFPEPKEDLKVPEPLIVQPIISASPIMEVPVLAPKKTGLTIDEMILEVANARMNAKVKQAEDEKKEFINNSYKKLLAVLTEEPTSPLKLAPSQATPPVIPKEEPKPEPPLQTKKEKGKPQKTYSPKTAILVCALGCVLVIVTAIILSVAHVL